MTTAAPAPPATATVRQLPPEEWERLAGLPFAAGGLPDPRYAAILVAETPEGEIVGVWAALTTIHLDGLWVDPSYRRSTHVAARLLRGMRALLRDLGVRCAFTLVESSEVLMLALKAGFTRLPHVVCLLDLTEGDPSCQSPPSSR